MVKMMQRQSERAEKLKELKADLLDMLVINNVKLLDKFLGIERDENLMALKKSKKMELVQFKLKKLVFYQETIMLNFTKAGKRISLAEMVDHYKCFIDKIQSLIKLIYLILKI